MNIVLVVHLTHNFQWPDGAAHHSPARGAVDTKFRRDDGENCDPFVMFPSLDTPICQLATMCSTRIQLRTESSATVFVARGNDIL